MSWTQSLKRLQTDYVDLYQIHRWDEETPIEETLEALHDVVKAGKVRYIGASSMYSWQFAKAQYLADRHGWTRFVSMQNHYNLLYREEEREMIPLCREEGDRGDSVEPAGAGAVGAAVAKRDDEAVGDGQRFGNTMYARTEEADHRVVDRLDGAGDRSAAFRRRSWRWHGCWRRPGITAPIVGATKPNHLEDAVAALSVKLTPEEMAGLEAGVCAASGAGVQLSAVRDSRSPSNRRSPWCPRSR
jgi:aryl-alcohol dehydrogenase-like predicted oxidoreductase